MSSDITVVISAIPERADLLARAVASVASQTLPPAFIIVSIDANGDGAAITRTRGLEQVTTKWVAFLDDDDEFMPEHLAKLRECADQNDADFVFPWFVVKGGTDPFPLNEARDWDITDPHQTTVTVLVRTEAALKVGGFIWEGMDDTPGEEFEFAVRLGKAGYKIVKLHERTWYWYHWAHRGRAANTMGRPSRREFAYHGERQPGHST